MPEYYTNYLIHHGIKGQKWGVRRYQNPDGSYTPAGAKRYESVASRTTIGEAHRKNVEYDKKISMYNNKQISKGKQFIKNTLFGRSGQMTYNMARAAGESRGKAYLRSMFDINLTRVASTAAGTIAGNTVRKAGRALTESGALYKMNNRGYDPAGDMKGKVASNIAGTVTTGVVARAADNYAARTAYRKGRELSLQQRALRKKYGGGY